MADDQELRQDDMSILKVEEKILSQLDVIENLGLDRKI